MNLLEQRRGVVMHVGALGGAAMTSFGGNKEVLKRCVSSGNARQQSRNGNVVLERSYSAMGVVRPCR